MRLGAEASVASVLALDPEVVVCATGSVPRVPAVAGIDAALADGWVTQGWEVLAGRAEVGARVAVVSEEDHFETPNVADALAEAGHAVEIFHKWLSVGSQIDRYSVGAIMARLAHHAIAVHTPWRLEAVEGRTLVLRSALTGDLRHEDGFDTVVLVAGSVPDTTLYQQLRAEGSVPHVTLAGSAWVPRLLAEATQHGAQVGLEI